MNIWVQKSRFELKRGRKGWHCKTYFEGIGNDPTQPYPSGGRGSTKSPQSMSYIRQIRPGDLVVIYQGDEDAIFGISQADSPGMEADKGSRQFNLFYLKPATTAFKLSKPLTLTDLRATGCDPKCFGPGTMGRIFPLELGEFVGIIKAISKVNPDQTAALSAWVRDRSK